MNQPDDLIFFVISVFDQIIEQGTAVICEIIVCLKQHSVLYQCRRKLLQTFDPAFVIYSKSDRSPDFLVHCFCAFLFFYFFKFIDRFFVCFFNLFDFLFYFFCDFLTFSQNSLYYIHNPLKIPLTFHEAWLMKYLWYKAEIPVWLPAVPFLFRFFPSARFPSSHHQCRFH